MLVGRDAALETLAAATRAAAHGRPSFVLVTGDPGVGKTALLAEVVRRVTTQGTRVLWGQCWQAEGTPVYWPWRQILRAGDGRASDVGGLALARLLAPQDRTADARPHDPRSTRFEMFDDVVRWLAHLAEAIPVVVVLDDLHWADDGSCALLAFAARHLRAARVLLLGAYRDLEAPAKLDLLTPHAELLPLDGLDAKGVAAVMADVTGTTPARDDARQMCTRTGGNPLFVRELTRMLTNYGAPAGHAQPPAQHGVYEILQRQTSHLTPACRQMLMVAAVAGRELRPDLLRRVLPGADRLSDLVAEATDARVLAGSAGTPDTHRFRHDLFREAVLVAMTPTQRGAIHLALGRALDEVSATMAPVQAAEAAGHYVAAWHAGHGEAAACAVAWSRSAAHDALTKLAASDARGHYEQALAIVDATTSGAADERIDLVLDLADARDRAGETAVARATYLGAADGARHTSDPVRLARAALGVHALGAPSGMSHAQSIALLEEAVGSLSDSGHQLVPLLLAGLARDLHHSWEAEHRPRATRLAEEAVALARRRGDTGTTAHCLLALHDARWLPGSAAGRLDIVDEIIPLAAGTDDLDLQAEAHLLRAAARIELGDHRGRGDLTEYCHRAERSGHTRGRWKALSRHATVALIDGDVDLAADLSAEAASLGRRIGQPDWNRVADGQLWEVLRFRGERDRYAELGHSGPLLASWPPWTALGAVDAGDADAAARMMAGFHVDRGFLPGPRTNPEPWSMAIVAEAVAMAGTRQQREEMYRRLRPLAGMHVVTGGCASYSGTFDRYLGLLADALEDHALAERHHTDAIALHEHLGAPRWLALSMRDRQRSSGRAGAARPVVLRREGDTWRLTFVGRSTHLPNLKGLQDLAALIGQPGRPVHALDLARGPGSDASRTVRLGADAVLDADAKAAYRDRLRALATEIDEAERHHDLHRLDRARVEHDTLVHELSTAVGLGGRDRRLGDEAERARKTVSSRIRDTIRRIRLEDADLGDHLAAAVSTGAWCCYEPPAT